MVSSLAAGDGRRRFLIATGVTKGLSDTGADQVVESVNAVVGLAVGVFGYERVTSLGLDPTADQLRRSIHSFCAERDPDDVVLIYHTGHAELTTEREHRLWMGDTRVGDRAELMRTRDIVEMALSDTRVGNLLIMLDTCYAARGSSDAAITSLEWLERDVRRTFVVMSSAHPLEEIQPGEFAQLLGRAVHHQASGGTEPQYLHAGVLAHHMMSDERRLPSQTITAATILNSTPREIFFPNPRYDPTISGRDEYFKQQQEHADKRRREIHDHFAPRGRGVESASEQAWRFVGRHAALRNLASWLGGQNADPRSRIVTGRPGSGKSALLGRLVLLSDKELRGSVPLNRVPADTIPRPGSIDVAVHARSKTTTEIREALAVALGVRERCDTVGDLLRALRIRRDRTLCAVVDAVDEAVDQHDLVRTLLRPLIDDGPEAGLRLLIGTRAHLLDELGSGAVVLDLDTTEFSDRQSMVDYAERNLRETHDESPYRDADPELVHAVADAVTERANLSFLVAMIVSRTLAAAPEIPDPTDQDWRRSLPSTAAQAMAHDLDTRLRPADAETVRHLLAPLAFAYGAGLPWEDIWVPLANQISGRRYTDADVLWLRRTAGSYLVETLEAERSAYRLYHEALAEHVRESHTAAKVHSTIVDFFLAYCITTPRGRQWRYNHNYALTHLSTHAAAAGRLYNLVDDPDFLIEAEQSNLLAAFGASRTSGTATTAAVYQLASHHLRNKPRDERASYLELTAHKVNATDLAAALRTKTAQHTWSTKWARWKPENPHRVLHAHNGWVTGLARLPARGAYRDMIASCSDDRTIRFWDVRKGIADGVPLYGHDGQVLAIEVVDLPDHGKLLLISAGGDGTVRVWDIPSRRQRDAPLTGHQDKVRYLAYVVVDGRPVVFSADRAGRLLVWDLLDQRPLNHPLARDMGTVACLAAFRRAGNRDLLVVASNQATKTDYPGRISVYDASTGTKFARFTVSEPVRGVHQATEEWLVVVTDTAVLRCSLRGEDLETVPHQHVAPVSWSSCATSPQGNPLAITTSTDGTIRTFDVQRMTLAGPPLSGSHRHSTSALHVFLDDNQTMVVSGNNDGTLRLWDVDRRTQPTAERADAQVRGIVVDDSNEQSTYIYAAGRHKIRKLRMDDGQVDSGIGPTDAPIVALTGAPRTKRSNQLSPTADGVYPFPLIVADKRGGLYCLERFLPGRGLVTLDRRDLPTSIINMGTTLLRRIMTASAYESGVVRLQSVDLDTRPDSARHRDGPQPYSAEMSFSHPPTCLTLSQWEGQQIVIGLHNGSIHLWNTGNNSVIDLAKSHTDAVTALAVRHNLLASAADDHRIVLWRLDTPATPLLMLTEQHTRHIHALTWLPTDQDEHLLLISGGAEGVLRIWHVDQTSSDRDSPHGNVTVSAPFTIDLGAPIRAAAPAPDRTVVVGTDHGIAVLTLTGQPSKPN